MTESSSMYQSPPNTMVQALLSKTSKLSRCYGLGCAGLSLTGLCCSSLDLPQLRTRFAVCRSCVREGQLEGRVLGRQNFPGTLWV